jgi:hypothetical protein
MKKLNQYINEKLILKKNLNNQQYIEYFAEHLNLENDNEIVTVLAGYVEKNYGNSISEIRAIRSTKEFITGTENLYELDETLWKKLYDEFDDGKPIAVYDENPPCDRYENYYIFSFKNYIGIDARLKYDTNNISRFEMVFFEILT